MGRRATRLRLKRAVRISQVAEAAAHLQRREGLPHIGGPTGRADGIAAGGAVQAGIA
jgi:hypothetical protein